MRVRIDRSRSQSLISFSGDEAGPIIEGWAKVATEVFAATLHFDQHDRLPNIIGKRGSAATFLRLANAMFQCAANLLTTRLAEALEVAIKKYLRLAFFVAGDMLVRPGDEFFESFAFYPGTL